MVYPGQIVTESKEGICEAKVAKKRNAAARLTATCTQAWQLSGPQQVAKGRTQLQAHSSSAYAAHKGFEIWTALHLTCDEV